MVFLELHSYHPHPIAAARARLLEACASANPKDFQAFSALPSAARKENCPSRTGFILSVSPHPDTRRRRKGRQTKSARQCVKKTAVDECTTAVGCSLATFGDRPQLLTRLCMNFLVSLPQKISRCATVGRHVATPGQVFLDRDTTSLWTMSARRC